MTMPVMDGEEAFRLLRAISADVPMVISAGYNEGATRELFGAGAVGGIPSKAIYRGAARRKDPDDVASPEDFSCGSAHMMASCETDSTFL
jgi:CheY-like chemotaxis protein